MQINQQKTNQKKTAIIVSIIILLIASLVIGYYVWFRPDQKNDITNDSIDTNSTTNNEKTDQSTHNREAEKDPVQNDSDTIDQTSLSGYITAKNIVNENLQIRLQIEQYLTSGTCKITIGNYSEQVNVISNPSSSTCSGWDIPINKLRKGTQNIIIEIISGDNTLTISDEVTI